MSARKMDNLKTNDKFKAGTSKSDLQGGDLPKSDEEKHWTISDFDIARPLGNGKFGNVYLARKKETGHVVALKVCKIYCPEMKNQVLREVKIQKGLRHPNILRLYGWFNDEERIYMILEYAKYGSLYKILKESGRFDEKTAAFYIRDLTKALIYCHANKVIHRDLKPENLLIGDDWQLKIADFGWSVRTSTYSKRKTLCGTLEYISPEMVAGKPHNYAIDIWCLGVLCYELLVGLPPFEAQNSHQMCKKIRYVIIKYPKFISKEATDLIGKLLVVNPEQRLPLTHVLQHPWVIDNAPVGVPPPVFPTEQKQS